MGSLTDKRKSNFRILEVERKGFTKDQVLVRYYDTSTMQIHEKEDFGFRITPSIEVLFEKYGYKSPNELLEAIKEKYPKGESKYIKYSQVKSEEEKETENKGRTELEQNEFLRKALEKAKGEEDNTWEDIDLYVPSQNSVIIQHIGDFNDAKEIEFFVRPDKQIFIKNSDKRYRVRTERMSADELALEKQNLECILNTEDTRSITVKSDYVEAIVSRTQLNELNDMHNLRIFEYDSLPFTKEDDAEKLVEKIKEEKLYKKCAERARVIIDRSEKKPKYIVRVNSSKSNEQFLSRLHKNGFWAHTKKGKHQVSTAELKWDPLGENTVAQQLRWFFPIHSEYDPRIPLSVQINTNPDTFSYYKKKEILEPEQTIELEKMDFWEEIKGAISNHIENIFSGSKKPFVPYKGKKINKKERKVSRIQKSELESAVDDAYDFYKNNFASIDLEVIDWAKDRIPSGRIFMAVLRSNKENKIYVTKEFWKDENIRKVFEEKYKDHKGKIIYLEEELDLVAALAKDAEKYEFITGHNYLAYDKEHLKKFDAKEYRGNLTETQRKKIRNYKKELKHTRFWQKTDNKALDTMIYLKNRMDLLHDNKLSTYAGFEKSIDYKEMARIVKEGTPEERLKVINYTFEDGDKSMELTEKLIYNAVLEQMVVNKPLSTVFNTDPRKEFYDSAGRSYFMKKGTFRNRHDRRFRKHFDKLKERTSPSEIFYDFVKNLPQETGVHSEQTELYYPSIFIDAFKELIDASPALLMIYDTALEERDPVLKADLFSKLSNALIVPVDKVKNYMEDAGLEFGKHYDSEDVYNFLHAKDEEDAAKLFAEKQEFELSRRSWIFGIEYGIRRKKDNYMNLPVERTMLELNNKVANLIQEFRQNQHIGITKNYYFGNNLPGYKIANIRNMINLPNERAVGIIDYNDSFLEFYGNMKQPKNDFLKKHLVAVLYKNEPLSVSVQAGFVRQITKLTTIEKQLFQAISDIKPKKRPNSKSDDSQQSFF